MAGRHRGEPVESGGAMLAILDGLVSAVDAAETRSREAGDGDNGRRFDAARHYLRAARVDLLAALTSTDGES